MSDLPQQSTLRQYQADGLTTIFTYPFLILLDTDISVYVTLSGNTPNPTTDIKVLGVDYTVTNVGNSDGGTVVFTIAPALGAIVTLERTMQISIDTNFNLAQNFNGANLDAAFERVTLFTQQTNTLLQTRALQYIVNSYLPNVNSNQIPTLGNGQVWSGLNGAIVATTIETSEDISLLRSQLASQAPLGEGALLVGYYDTVNKSPTNIGKYLDYKDVYGIDSGVADAMILTIPNSNFVYSNGQTIHIVVNHTNLTTTPTLNVNGLGAIVIKRNPTSSAQAGDLPVGTVVELLYDATANNFYIVNLVVSAGSFTTPTIQILSGSGTYVKPSSSTWIWVKLSGDGGGSGGALCGSPGQSMGSGGGGGGYLENIYSSPSSTYSYSVGTGGSAGSAGGNGGSGGNTTFGSLTANGGSGGTGSTNVSVNSYISGGAGGAASGGNIINIPGESGGYAFCPTGIVVSGSGGGSKLSSGSQNVGGNNIATNGNPGINFGGGASGGAVRTSVSGSATGAPGATGTIIVLEFYA